MEIKLERKKHFLLKIAITGFEKQKKVYDLSGLESVKIFGLQAENFMKDLGLPESNSVQLEIGNFEINANTANYLYDLSIPNNPFERLYSSNTAYLTLNKKVLNRRGDLIALSFLDDQPLLKVMINPSLSLSRLLEIIDQQFEL